MKVRGLFPVLHALYLAVVKNFSRCMFNFFRDIGLYSRSPPGFFKRPKKATELLTFLYAFTGRKID